MTNSQYSNQVQISINELLRIKFLEVCNFGEGEKSQEIIVISMAMEAAEMLANTLLKSVADHREKLTSQNKELN